MVNPIVGPYVSINQLSQFKTGRANTSNITTETGNAGFDLGMRLPSANAGQIATMAKQLAQRTIPGTVEQARQAASILARQARGLVGG